LSSAAAADPLRVQVGGGRLAKRRTDLPRDLVRRTHHGTFGSTASADRPWAAGLIEGVFGRGDRRRAVGGRDASGGAKSERKSARLGGVGGRAETAFPQVR